FNFTQPRGPADVKADSRVASDPVDAPLAPRLLPPAFAAGGADAVELHPVAADREAEEASDPLLQPLELVAGELDDLPAALADDVVVMLVLALDRLEARLTVVEVALGGQTDIVQELERAVDRRVTHSGVRLPDRAGAPLG